VVSFISKNQSKQARFEELSGLVKKNAPPIQHNSRIESAFQSK
jgi:hypothetical protein